MTLGSLREKLAPFFPHMSLAEVRSTARARLLRDCAASPKLSAVEFTDIAAAILLFSACSYVF